MPVRGIGQHEPAGGPEGAGEAARSPVRDILPAVSRNQSFEFADRRLLDEQCMALAVRIAVAESRREKAPALHTRQPTRTRWDRGTVGGTTDRNADRTPGTREAEQLIVLGCHV